MPKAKSSKMIGVQTLELEPLVALWQRKNPNVATSHLVRRGLKLALREIAGKRYAHLVNN